MVLYLSCTLTTFSDSRLRTTIPPQEIEYQRRRRATFTHIDSSNADIRFVDPRRSQEPAPPSKATTITVSVPSRLTGLSLGQFLPVLALILALIVQFFVPVYRRFNYQDQALRPVREAVCPSTPFEPPTCLPPPALAPQELHTFDSLSSRNMALAEAAQKVAKEFDYTTAQLNEAVEEFLREMDEGLAQDGTSLSQIPTYVTAVPNGTEKGLYMSVDLGGTNFRVCSIQLHGNTTFSLTQSKVKIPTEIMTAATAEELFAFLAKQIQLFLKEHHTEHYEGHMERIATGSTEKGYREQEIFSLGFTFSFPVHQIGINKGLLMRWTKGFDIADAIGRDVCGLLQTEIDKLDLPVRVAALVNDTVGTLMARSYTSPGKTGTLVGAIFGTGTNGAYVEKLARVTKLVARKENAEVGAYDASTGEMVVNTEWGSFDNALAVLPNTPYDAALDAESVNPGIQMFEKRVSGMFLGEVLRRAIVALLQTNEVPLFKDENSSLNELHSTTQVGRDSPLFARWGLDSSFLSVAHGDASPGLRITRQALDRDLGVSAASVEDAEAIKVMAAAVGRRAARLSAVALGAIVLESGRLDTVTGDEEADVVDIGVDGSLVEFYPGFEDYIREALREINGIGPAGEKRIRIGIAKDGSGVGAALSALVAGKQNLAK